MKVNELINMQADLAKMRPIRDEDKIQLAQALAIMELVIVAKKESSEYRYEERNLADYNDPPPDAPPTYILGKR